MVLPQTDLRYVALGIGLLALILVAVTAQGVSNQRRRVNRLVQGPEGNIESSLVAATEAVKAAQAQVAQLEQRVAQLEDELQNAITRVGMVRFNPFSDTGSDLSFAVALMNRRDSGLVLTGLWGREEVRVYAKQLLEGQSQHPLSQEERQALDLARRQKPR